MLNEYPLWKYLLLIILIAVGALYAAPNLYGEDPALQISATRQSKLDESTLVRVEEHLKKAAIEYKSLVMTKQGMSVRFSDTETQLKAMTIINRELGEQYTVALNLLASTPDWLASFNAKPMYLGLDLRGGVHFLMEVDVDAAIKQTEESNVSDMRSSMRQEKIRYLTVARKPATGERPAGIEIKFKSAEERDNANSLIRKSYGDLVRTSYEEADRYFLLVSFSESGIRELKRYALQQNITTLRNRVNELGVAEPIIQQQGLSRIVVQLPGVQDTSRAKKILGTTATLEYRLVDIEHSVQDALNGHVPVGSKLYYERNGNPVLLKKRTIVTGDQITNASSSIDQTNSQPAVLVTLNGKGARRMGDVTKENIGKPMAVVFKEKRGKKLVEEVINIATIRDSFSKRFQTTGLDSSEEAHDLALLLRAGSLSAPVEII
ncbi:MAG: preprotein translocase subunit SecD, partial [Gammaproteobacteria bacterium]|nr:preprotein translocase subunit SecD [Gammaproteobacteria bacterium]